MGFTEVLTLLFVALKLTGEINWSWWLVLLPELVALAWYVVVLFSIIGLFGGAVAVDSRRQRRAANARRTARRSGW